MPQVALSSEFLTAFADIPKKKQKAVREALEKFKRDPTTAAQHYEKIHDVIDDKVRTVRCGIDYRAIVIHPPKGDVHLFVWVDHHDEAMKWASKRRFEVNKHTGTLQVYEVQPSIAAPDSGGDAGPLATPGGSRALAGIESHTIPPGRLFSGYDDTTLLLFGVPEPLMIAVRALREVSDLDELSKYLPQEAQDSLYLLAAGYTPEQTIDELDRQKLPDPQKPEFDPEDFGAALKRPGTEQQFKLVESDHELAEILNAPLAKWRIFLHPSQQKLVNIESTGPVRVLGGAGTGKTVVAMHRARHLAKEKCPPGEKVLFTTFTTNLADDIGSMLESLCGKEIEQLEVTNLHAWATGILQSRGIKVRLASDELREAGWSEAYTLDPDDRFPLSFYQGEWLDVAQAQSILTESDYLRARRAGRGTRLSREQRRDVWKVLEGYRRFLQSKGVMEAADTIREARLLLEEGKVPLRYAAVVADEVQDFSESELRLLRALVPEGPNDLFLVGDAHQRIYGHKASLSRCGINVRGMRSRRLRLNYRTTHNIRNWSVALLRGLSVDDLDEGTDDALKGYHSLRMGGPPTVVHCPTEQKEAAFVLERIRGWLDGGRKPSDICLTARTHGLLDKRYAPLLREAGIPVQFIKTEEPKQGDGVRLATLHRIKGLEFPCVLVASVNEGSLPLELKYYPDDAALQDHLDTERRLLFVAATRARDELVVTGFGRPSAFLR
jgi:hypothetical protein